MGNFILYHAYFLPELSAMIDGAHDGENVIVKYYVENEVETIFKDFCSKNGWWIQLR